MPQLLSLLLWCHSEISLALVCSQSCSDGVLDVLMENTFLYPVANPAVSTKSGWNLIWQSLHGQALGW